MKRFTALLLIFVMLIMLLPMSTVVDAEKIGDVPFYGIIQSVPSSSMPYIYHMPSTWTNTVNAGTEWPEVNLYGSNFEVEIAQLMKEAFDERPEGARYFELDLIHTGFFGKLEKGVYYDEAIEFVKQWVVEFLKAYKNFGGKLDGIIVDLEYFYSHAYYLDKNLYDDIVDDPRFDTVIRPRLEKYGFVFSNGDTEIDCINANQSGHGYCYSIWNTVMDEIEREAINKAVLEPLLEYYPDATLSDYQSSTTVTWEKCVESHGDLILYNTVSAGNLSNTNSYVGGPEAAYFGWGTPVYRNPPSYNDAVFEATPFNVTMFDVNDFKSMYLSTDDGMFDAWIAPYRYNESAKGYGGTYCGTPYYSELMYHIGLLNPQAFLGYFIASEIESSGTTVDDASKTISDIMVELTRVAGTSDRKAIQVSTNWNGSYILSGMYSGGRNIWRLTPDTSVVSLQNFKVAGNDPTFKIDGLTITFPGGKIIENGSVHEAGSCGYWIETPKNVNPVITADAERYRNNPSFEETFEGYSVGSSFTSSAALPKTCWNVTGTAKIQANGTDNKSLALSGSTTVKNEKLPQNITAGDDYAKQQAWEVTVTLPSNLKNSAVVKLFTCADGDLGVKITDGKVYYDQAGSYRQMDGVSLSAGTYTVRREVDFRTAGSYTSDYTIYDANGILLGEAKDVPIKSFALPVTTITMETISANTDVLLDDYKLYPTGFAAVFDLYDAETGIELTNLGNARNEDTAYRLSWLNATAESQIAYVYDSVSGDVIEAIGMAPGMDGVATGVVEVVAGKSVKLAVRTEVGELPSSGTDGGNGNQSGGTDVTEPSGSVDTTSPSDGTDKTEPTSGSDATVPSGDSDTTNPSDGTDVKDPGTQTPGAKRKVSGGVIALIVVLSLAIFGGGGFALYWFVIRPKLAVKQDTEQTQIMEDDME